VSVRYIEAKDEVVGGQGRVDQVEGIVENPFHVVVDATVTRLLVLRGI
jgi:hypothetical protein